MTSLGPRARAKVVTTRAASQPHRTQMLRLCLRTATSKPCPSVPLPAYSRSGNKEPVTLAMYLFRFGFLFPPFWIIGALILTSKLQAPAEPSPESDAELAWLPDKTTAERDAIVQHIRRVEVKWAKRSLIAILVLCILVAMITPLAILASSF
ncbi:hypothetical protein HGRIS_003150 [Hohenbuehelia grisea]|uniref:Uncharacterized protein n=1 Tax=Hohenbuehelia grisea TaxID=104357 RepID=A0ABR3JMK3_9AGAR